MYSIFVCVHTDECKYRRTFSFRCHGLSFIRRSEVIFQVYTRTHTHTPHTQSLFLSHIHMHTHTRPHSYTHMYALAFARSLILCCSTCCNNFLITTRFSTHHWCVFTAVFMSEHSDDSTYVLLNANVTKKFCLLPWFVLARRSEALFLVNLWVLMGVGWRQEEREEKTRCRTSNLVHTFAVALTLSQSLCCSICCRSNCYS